MKKIDIIIVLLMAAGIVASFQLMPRAQMGRTLIIYAGEKKTVRSLEDSVFQVDGPGGSLTVKVEDRKVRVIETKCHDRWCMAMGPIEKPGQSIVCLPSRIMISISDGEGDENQADTFTR